MAKTIDKHPIDDDIHIFKSDNSSRWFARFKVGTAWKTKSTKKRDKQQAIIRAIQLQTEYKTKVENNLSIFTQRKSIIHTFKAIAKKAIKRMEAETAEGIGKVVFKDYIHALNKYHVPFFGNLSVRDIDAQSILDFDSWRIDKFKRVHARSTISTHNAALQRVFDEAVIGKHITATELPILKNKGIGGKRRAAFSHSEYLILLEASRKWMGTGRKKVTKDTRTLLHYYIQFAVLTGIRPGKEVEFLTWGDVHDRSGKSGNYTSVTVQKGKTTLYTGTREIVCKDGIKQVLDGVASTLKQVNKDDLIFTLPDGKLTTEIGRNFTKLLKNTGLKNSPHGERSLYSLRHTYITWELLGKTEQYVIAAQCGTSAELIGRHYSHVTPSMFASQLSGVGSRLNLTSVSGDDEIDFIGDDNTDSLPSQGASIRKE